MIRLVSRLRAAAIGFRAPQIVSRGLVGLDVSNLTPEPAALAYFDGGA